MCGSVCLGLYKAHAHYACCEAMHVCACLCVLVHKAHAHCCCCEAMHACVGVCVWAGARLMPTLPFLVMHVSVHEQGVRSARQCMYERMCVCMNKEYVHAKLCVYAHIHLCVRE